MIVDCDRCEVRGDACGDCVITALLGTPPEGVRLGSAEQRAIDALAGAGLVPKLRLVSSGTSRPDTASTGTRKVARRANRRAERSSREAG